MRMQVPYNFSAPDVAKQQAGSNAGLGRGELVLNVADLGLLGYQDPNFAQLLAVGADNELKSAIGPPPATYHEYAATNYRGIPNNPDDSAYFFVSCNGTPGDTAVQVDSQFPNGKYPEPKFENISGTCISANGNICELSDDVPPLFGNTTSLKIDNSISSILGGAYFEITNTSNSFYPRDLYEHSISFYIYITDNTRSLYGIFSRTTEADPGISDELTFSVNPRNGLASFRSDGCTTKGFIPHFDSTPRRSGSLIRNAWNHVACVCSAFSIPDRPDLNFRSSHKQSSLYINGLLVDRGTGGVLPLDSDDRSFYWGSTPTLERNNCGKIYLQNLLYSQRALYSTSFDPFSGINPYVVGPQAFISSATTDVLASSVGVIDIAVISSASVNISSVGIDVGGALIGSGTANIEAPSVFVGFRAIIASSTIDYESTGLSSEVFIAQIGSATVNFISSGISSAPVIEGAVFILDVGDDRDTITRGPVIQIDVGDDRDTITRGAVIEIDLGEDPP